MLESIESETMTKINFAGLCLFGGICLVGMSCDKDEPMVAEEKQVITTMRYTLMSSGGNETVVLSYRDLDGIGGNEAVIEGGELNASSIYFGSMEFLNEAGTPPENIRSLIEADKNDYQVFFKPSGLGISFIYADVDDSGFPLGLFTAVNTGAPGTGTLNISLVKGPNKSGINVSEGIIDNAGGQIQLNVTFPVVVK